MRRENSPGDDERRSVEGSGGSSSGLARQQHRTTSDTQSATRRAEVRNVYAEGVQVRGTRGRDRLLLFVSCWLCGRTHQHGAKTDFISGTRTAACGLGAYVVLLGAVEGEVAA